MQELCNILFINENQCITRWRILRIWRHSIINWRITIRIHYSNSKQKGKTIYFDSFPDMKFLVKGKISSAIFENSASKVESPCLVLNFPLGEFISFDKLYNNTRECNCKVIPFAIQRFYLQRHFLTGKFRSLSPVNIAEDRRFTHSCVF